LQFSNFAFIHIDWYCRLLFFLKNFIYMCFKLHLFLRQICHVDDVRSWTVKHHLYLFIFMFTRTFHKNFRCTANDLKMIVRLIKHDLRINAGPKHMWVRVFSISFLFRNRFNNNNLKNTYICIFALRTHYQSRGCPRGRVQGLSVVPRSGSGGATFLVERGGKTVCLGFIPKPEQSGHLVDDAGFTDAGTLK